MGLLDYFDQSTGNNDPLGGLLAISKKDKTGAIGQALFQAGMGILSAKTGGNVGAAIGQGGMQGLQTYNSAMDDLKREKVQGYQMQRQQNRDAKADEWAAKVQGRQEGDWARADETNATLDNFKKNFPQFINPDGTLDEQKAIAAWGSIDPAYAMKMKNDYDVKKEAIAARRDQSAASNKPYLTPVTGADGKIYAFDHRTGTATPIAASVTPSGGGTQQPPSLLRDPKYDPSLQRDVAAGRSYGTERGQTAAQNEAAAPAELAVADQIISNIDKIANNPNLGAATGLTGVVDPRSYIPGTALYDLKNKNDQLTSETFMQARQMLKGGGAITDFEGKKAEAAVARLNMAQSDEEYRAALQDFRDAVVAGRDKIVARQSQGSQMGLSPAPATTATRTFKVLR